MAKESTPKESSDLVGQQKHEFAWTLHWVGVALLAYFFVDLCFQAWPVALLQPAWLDRMNGFLVSRGTIPLIGGLFAAGAAIVDSHSKEITNRANFLRRFASWAAIGYLLLVPIQVYSGVMLLRGQQQQATQLLADATKSAEAIQQSTSEAELRMAYAQIPGSKEPLPEQLPLPLNVLRDQLVEMINARSKRAEYDFQQRMSSLWQRSIGLIFGNILRALIFFLGFAAIGRSSPNHPTLLLLVLTRKWGVANRHRRRGGQKLATGIPEEWMVSDDNT
jgi:hypothetical protein